MTTAYIMLGAAESGRRKILADLADSIGEPESIRIYTPSRIPPADWADLLSPETEVLPWGITDGTLSVAEPETAPETVFILTDGRANPVDQMEILAALLRNLGWEVARVLTVVHCRLLADHPALADWFKACIHFSDVALLGQRDSVPNSWIRDFLNGYKEACYPCLFELVKQGRVDNPARVLLPEPRRLSMIFDETDALDDMEFDEDNLPDEPFDLVAKPDPYFERTASGSRRILLPEISQFLPVS